MEPTDEQLHHFTSQLFQIGQQSQAIFSCFNPTNLVKYLNIIALEHRDT